MRYLISYDLNKQKDYKSLTDALVSWGAKKVLYSQWCVRLNNSSAAAIRDALWKVMDSDDRLLVVEIDGTGWAGMNLINKISDI